MNNYDEDRSVFNGHYEVEILIDRPVAHVWRQFLDVGSWVSSHDIDTVCGAQDSVGSITRVAFKKAQGLEMPLPHYHFCKIIKLVPERQYVLKTFSEKGGSYGWQITAFDDTRFIEIDGRTKMIFNIFAEIRAESVAKDPTPMNLDESREGTLRNFNNLKRIVESS